MVCILHLMTSGFKGRCQQVVHERSMTSYLLPTFAHPRWYIDTIEICLTTYISSTGEAGTFLYFLVSQFPLDDRALMIHP